MKKSYIVGLTLLGVYVVALEQCSRNQQCLDQNNVVVDDRSCQQTSTGYHWFYTHSSPGAIGTHIDPSSGTTRGIFGGAGDAAGSHGGGGE